MSLHRLPHAQAERHFPLIRNDTQERTADRAKAPNTTPSNTTGHQYPSSIPARNGIHELVPLPKGRPRAHGSIAAWVREIGRSPESAQQTYCALPSWRLTPKPSCSRAIRPAPAACWPVRCAREPPCTTRTSTTASRTSTSGRSTRSTTTGHSPRGGAGGATSARQSSAGILAIRLATQVDASTSSAAHFPPRRAPIRPTPSAAIWRPRRLGRLGNLRRRQSS
jgi:hypothetical protein